MWSCFSESHVFSRLSDSTPEYHAKSWRKKNQEQKHSSRRAQITHRMRSSHPDSGTAKLKVTWYQSNGYFSSFCILGPKEELEMHQNVEILWKQTEAWWTWAWFPHEHRVSTRAWGFICTWNLNLSMTYGVTSEESWENHVNWSKWLKNFKESNLQSWVKQSWKCVCGIGVSKPFLQRDCSNMAML